MRNADGYGLLADTEMDGATDVAILAHIGQTFLHESNEEHHA
jgi:hypothetical protein